MKTIYSYSLILILTIIHVHFSIDTQDNLLNPLSFLMMCSSRTEWISERDAYYCGGLLIHSIVTIGISWFFFKWNRLKIWVLDVAVCILIGLYIRYVIDINFHPTKEMCVFYESLYNTKRPGICNDVMIFTFIQFSLLSLYLVTSMLFCKNSQPE